jgi:hypothetical protein
MAPSGSLVERSRTWWPKPAGLGSGSVVPDELLMGYVREVEMSKKVKLREGDWFVVPIDGPRWVLGLIARRKGHSVFGYFFAPAWDHIPSLDEIGSPNARDSFIQLKFSDLGLLDGGWH